MDHVIDEHGPWPTAAPWSVTVSAVAGTTHPTRCQKAELAERFVVMEIQCYSPTTASTPSSDRVCSIGTPTSFCQETSIPCDGVAVDPQAPSTAPTSNFSISDSTIQSAGCDKTIEKKGVGDVDPDATTSCAPSLCPSSTAEQLWLIQVTVGETHLNAICKKQQSCHLQDKPTSSAANQSSSPQEDKI